MIKVYTSQDWMAVQTYKSVLESYGIACKVTGEFRASAAGELPPAQCWPELWVIDHARVEEAMKILAKAEPTDQSGQQTWTCVRCGEESEGQFDRCWKCGTGRPRLT